MTTTASDAERDIAIVEAFFDAFAAQDIERALALMSDDVVYQNVRPRQAGGRTHPRAVREAAHGLRSADEEHRRS